MLNLRVETWIRFVIWMALGFIIYFAYSRHRSRLAVGAAGVRPAGRRGRGPAPDAAAPAYDDTPLPTSGGGVSSYEPCGVGVRAT